MLRDPCFGINTTRTVIGDCGPVVSDSNFHFALASRWFKILHDAQRISEESIFAGTRRDTGCRIATIAVIIGANCNVSDKLYGAINIHWARMYSPLLGQRSCRRCRCDCSRCRSHQWLWSGVMYWPLSRWSPPPAWTRMIIYERKRARSISFISIIYRIRYVEYSFRNTEIGHPTKTLKISTIWNLRACSN